MKALAIALHAFRETVRQPVYLLLLALGAGLIVGGTQVGVFNFEQQAKMTIDLGLATLLIISLIVALHAASSSVADEIERRTALVVLSKPLRRETFLIGKFLGVSAASLLALALLTAVLLATVRATETGTGPIYYGSLGGVLLATLGLGWGARRLWRLSWRRALLVGGAPAYLLWLAALAGLPPGWRWEVALAAALSGLEVLLFAALAVALSTRLTLIQNAGACVVAFVVGSLSGWFFSPTRFVDGGLPLWAKLLRTVVPNLQNFNLFDNAADGVYVPWEAFLASGLYALVYCAFLLSVGCLLFRERELL